MAESDVFKDGREQLQQEMTVTARLGEAAVTVMQMESAPAGEMVTDLNGTLQQTSWETLGQQWMAAGDRSADTPVLCVKRSPKGLRFAQ